MRNTGKIVGHRRLTARFFVTADARIPLTNLPAPQRCPFCGCRDIEIALKRNETLDLYWMATPRCEGCGCEGPAASSNDADVKTMKESKEGCYSSQYCTIVEAARRWNLRRDLYSQSQREVA